VQHQNIDGSDINDSDVRLGQAGGDLILGDGNEITKIFVNLVGQKHPQWTDRQYRILKKVQQDVETRLSFTLNDDEVLIPLRLQNESKAVSRASLKLRRKLVTPQVQVQDLKQAILDVFCRADVQGRLLILGAPGGGKTTTLLTLAKELLAEAVTTPGTTIPVIFELSEWTPKHRSLKDWLIAQLKELYPLPQQESDQWLADELLLPLLDGLDELGMERQQQCIAAINAFAHYYPRVVVCCREQVYREGGATLDNLPGQVCLEPLSDQQIEHYLRDLGLEALWHDIQSSPAMRPMLELDTEGNPGILRVPLLLSMAAVTYDGQAFANRADLYEAYVEHRLLYDTRKADRDWRSHQKREWAYPALAQEPDSRQTQRTLRWLARQLQQNNTVELLIERIQPHWLDDERTRRYRLIGRLFFWLLGGLLGGLFGGLLSGLLGGLLGGLLSRSSGDGDLDNIQPVEAFKISISHVVQQKILKKLKIWLVGGLIIGSIAGLVGGLTGNLIGSLISNLAFGLSIGLIGGMIYSLKQSLELSGPDLKLRSRPNQGMWNSLQSLLWTTTLSYPIIVIPQLLIKKVVEKHSWLDPSGILLRNSPSFLLSGLAFSFFCGILYGGGVACLQHLCLRLVLWQSGIAPWNLARFLNYCVERKLLQRVGGRYRFLHRELLDHFAGQPPTV